MKQYISTSAIVIAISPAKADFCDGDSAMVSKIGHCSVLYSKTAEIMYKKFHPKWVPLGIFGWFKVKFWLSYNGNSYPIGRSEIPIRYKS